MIRKRALPKDIIINNRNASSTSTATQATTSPFADVSVFVEDTLLYITSALTPLGLSDTIEPREKLRTIIETAVNCAIELRVQRARFSVNPQKLLGEAFDPDTMEDLDAGEEEDWKNKKVGCVAWPAVWKSGDENGENTHLQNLIFKAQVILVD